MITIRLALPAERGNLEALQRRASLANTEDREALLAHPGAIHLPVEHVERGWVLVAADDDRLTGFAVILPRSDGDAELEGLFVEPSRWREGIGRTLVQHAVLAAKDCGARCLHVLGNPHAAHFYETCGFQKTGTASTQFGTAITMVLALDLSA